MNVHRNQLWLSSYDFCILVSMEAKSIWIKILAKKCKKKSYCKCKQKPALMKLL